MLEFSTKPGPSILSLAMFVAAFVLVARALFGENGYAAFEQQRFAYESLVEERDVLMAENEVIRDQIKKLEDDEIYQARVIRTKLGYLRPNEFVIFHAE